MRYSDNFIDVAFGDTDFEKMLSAVHPGDKLSAAAFLAALDGETEDVIREAFDHLDDLDAELNISDLPKAAGTGEAALRLRQEEQLVREERLIQGLEENDPLRLYLEEIAAIPVCGDINILAQDLKEANLVEKEEPELYQKLLNLSLSRIVQIAKEYTGYGVLLLDLI